MLSPASNTVTSPLYEKTKRPIGAPERSPGNATLPNGAVSAIGATTASGSADFPRKRDSGYGVALWVDQGS